MSSKGQIHDAVSGVPECFQHGSMGLGPWVGMLDDLGRPRAGRTSGPADDKGKGAPTPFPLSTYSAVGGLRQDPLQGAESPAVARTNGLGADVVDPLTASAFDLADHPHKADQALIAEDERH